MSNNNKLILCSVCVATYKRPELLVKLLRSLEGQDLPDNVKLEIIIVDNDNVQSAKSIVSKFEDSERIHFRYYGQPIKNIALTRNMAVAKASGDFILFIDDDEVATPKWISHLLKAIKDFNADGAFGPIYPEFHSKTPGWMKKIDLFYRPVAVTGTEAIEKRTGNCILTTLPLKQLKGPFSSEYGITGGSDTHLFERLEKQGCRFVFCQEASVKEYVPPSKTKVTYLFLRGLQGGNIYTRRALELNPENKILFWPWMVLKAFGYATISMIMVLINFSNAVRRTQWIIKFASNLGKILAAFGWYYRAYA